MIEAPKPGAGDDEPADPGTHLFFALCAGLVLAFAGWAAVGELDVVSTATGEVIPSSQVKSVQHLEGGIVREILVREGDHVEVDQPLVVLSATQSDADVKELEVRITSLKADAARLAAEAEGRPEPAFSPDLKQDHPELVSRATELFKARRSRNENDLAEQRQQVAQHELYIREISTRMRNYANRLKLLKEQIAISEELLKDELTNRMLHLNLLKEASDLEGKIAEDTSALQRQEAAFKAARIKLGTIRDTYQQDVRAELEKTRRDLGEYSNRMQKFQDSLRRTVLRSPVAGVVKSLYVVTVGGVVKAGDTVIDVVPEGDRLVVEAKLPTQEIGYVEPGQTAVVQLASSDAVRYGQIEGKVVHVSPDAIETKAGGRFYRVRIETERDHFERAGQRYRLYPGVVVMCSIVTGQRTVLEYILDPFLGSATTAMRER
jgi:adhesin transport system membrane fusion protein